MPTAKTASSIEVRLAEWQTIGSSDERRLRDPELLQDPAISDAVKRLQGRLDVRPTFGGLEVTSNSHVGQVEIGRLRIVITPKLDALPLTRLLCYAYGLRDLRLHDETLAPTVELGFQSLLSAMLATEVQALVQRGIPRRFRRDEAWLELPRGRILIDTFVRRGNLAATTLPCRYDERSIDWPLNRVILAGLHLGVAVCGDPLLRQRLQRLAGSFSGVGAAKPLDRPSVALARASLTRLTAACEPTLTLIDLLLQGRGLDAASTAVAATPLPGFLFDMNRFFQRLLSRFLHDYLPEWQVTDEATIHGMYSVTSAHGPARRPPAPRPDFAISKAGSVPMYLDAKYRDLSRTALPPHWLYQLGLYAAASERRTSVMLYATTNQEVADECIRIHEPGEGGRTGREVAAVILRAVPLHQLAHAVSPTGDQSARTLATRLVAPTLTRPSQCGQSNLGRRIPVRVGEDAFS